ncbi:hypothetical protein [Alteribacter natronophilus]|uniref:hypothetical protein n=1 Tax=Alteribacter natronophilus TaxID=2583810 RepID=UPI001486EA39|nr:hypothetical protein [Alteribacter natronophilus]
MEWLGIIILVIAGIIVLRVVGTIFKIVISIGLVLMFIYFLMYLINGATGSAAFF